MAIKPIEYYEDNSSNPLKFVADKAVASAASVGFTPKAIILILIVVSMMTIKIVIDLTIGTINFNVLTSLDYWVKNIATLVETSLILVLTSSAFMDRERLVNQFYKTYQDILNKYFNAIQDAHKDGAFRQHIANENHERKLNAYVSLLTQRKLKWEHKRLALGIRVGEENLVSRSKQRKFKHYTAKIEEIQTRIDRASEDVYVVKRVGVHKIKYIKVTHSHFFGGVKKTSARGIDFGDHDATSMMWTLFSKVLWFFVFGLGFGLVTSSFTAGDAITTKQWVDAAFSVLQMLIAVYFGATDGTDRVRKEKNHLLYLRCGFVGEFIEKEGIKCSIDFTESPQTK